MGDELLSDKQINVTQRANGDFIGQRAVLVAVLGAAQLQLLGFPQHLISGGAM